MTEMRRMEIPLWENAAREASLADPPTPRDVPRLVDTILAAARSAGASDVHLVPNEAGLSMAWRIDGVLHPVANFPRDVRSNVVGRLKVLADLLTYQTELPQEGRVRGEANGVEIRVSTFPTMFGEKAVVRLFVGAGRFATLDDLGLPGDISSDVRSLLHERGGVLLVTGPAGSGKTTTAYACLRHIIEASVPRSVATLEDPIEAIVAGAAQSQIRPVAGFTYETGLKSLLRQDPDVVLVGEIRDPTTALAVFQAALTGHLVVTTFHAGSAAEAIARLLDMGVEPYQLRSAVTGVLNQRLLRKLCACAAPSDSADDKLGLPIDRAFVPAGCEACRHTGYGGRILIGELLSPRKSESIRTAFDRTASGEIERAAQSAGMTTHRERACAAAERGQTSPAEVRRVFGFRPNLA